MTLGTEPRSYSELLAAVQPRAIRSEEDAERIQSVIDEIIDKPAALTTDERDLLALLGNLVAMWEEGRPRPC